MKKKKGAKDFIMLVLLKSSYQTPEAITQEIDLRYDHYCKCSSIERRLRELSELKLVVSKQFHNKNSNITHSRWKLKTEVVIKKPTLKDQAKEISAMLMRIIKKGEGQS